MRNGRARCMLSYEELKKDRSKFLALTGLSPREFKLLLPVFERAYRRVYPSDKTLMGQTRQRMVGGGRKSTLGSLEQKLLFILVYDKAHPRQELLGEIFELSQSRVNDWIHRLLPVLKSALDNINVSAECDPDQSACMEPQTNESEVISDKVHYRYEVGENQY